MLCPQCGKETPRGLCKKCFLEWQPIKFKKTSLKICRCGRHFYQGKWKKNLEKTLRKIMEKNLILPEEIKLAKLSPLSYEIKENNINLEIKLEADYRNEKIIQKLNPEIRIKKSQCDKCGKSREYYEALVQFRGFEPEIEINPEDLSTIKKTQGGVDVYMIKKDYARKIAREFRKKGFQVKESEKLTGINEHGKRKTRLTISIRKIEE